MLLVLALPVIFRQVVPASAEQASELEVDAQPSSERPKQSTREPFEQPIPSITITASELVALEKPPPEYPAEAKRLGIEGYVIVEFTVDQSGAVRDALVVSAEPSSVFDTAALKAVKRWRFMPSEGPDQKVSQVIKFRLKDKSKP